MTIGLFPPRPPTIHFSFLFGGEITKKKEKMKVLQYSHNPVLAGKLQPRELLAVSRVEATGQAERAKQHQCAHSRHAKQQRQL